MNHKIERLFVKLKPIYSKWINLEIWISKLEIDDYEYDDYDEYDYDYDNYDYDEYLDDYDLYDGENEVGYESYDLHLRSLFLRKN